MNYDVIFIHTMARSVCGGRLIFYVSFKRSILNLKRHSPLYLPSHSSNPHAPTPPLKYTLNQLPHPATRIIFLSRHSPIWKPDLPTFQIIFRRTIKESSGDERLFLFGEGSVGVVGGRSLNGGEGGKACRALFGGTGETADEGAGADCAGWPELLVPVRGKRGRGRKCTHILHSFMGEEE
jgi:hypothetical protein